MAKTKARKGPNQKVAEFPAPSDDSQGPDAEVPDPMPIETAEEQSAVEAPAREAAPTPPARTRNAIPKVLTFFQQLTRIQMADWGARAKIRVYRLEPIIDMRRGSANKYICIYTEPVDEERIKRDLGSGRYRLYLNFKNPGAQEEKELDSVEIDILDKNFPPNIPDGSWVDDPINKKWAWAKPISQGAAAAAASAASGNMLEAVQVLGQLQDRAEERARERIDSGRPQTWDPAQQLATVVTAAKDIAGALKATPENPIPAFISEQMAAMRTELAAQRQRSDVLMDRLLEMARGPQQQPNQFSAIKEITQGIKELLPALRDIWPEAPDAIANGIARSKLGPWQEFFQPVLPKLLETFGPLIPGMLAARNAPPQPTPGMLSYNPAQLPNPPQPQPPQARQPSHQNPNLDEMLLNALTNDREGGEFADSLIMLFGQQGQLMYRQAASLGEQGLLTLIQGRPVWNQLGPLQSKVPHFVHEFIEWGQEPEESGEETPVEGKPADAEVVDLTGEPA
jgi:hypothetical protein